MNLESKLTTFDCRLLTLDYIVIASDLPAAQLWQAGARQSRQTQQSQKTQATQQTQRTQATQQTLRTQQTQYQIEIKR
jgi:hypothetical protein